jgi:hypothetical protein
MGVPDLGIAAEKPVRNPGKIPFQTPPIRLVLYPYMM